MTLLRLRVNDIRVSLLKEKTLKECVADKLGIKSTALRKVQVLHRAVDARRKNNIGLLYHVMAEADVPLPIVSRQLGHHDSKVTADIYMHVTEERKKKDASLLDNVRIM